MISPVTFADSSVAGVETKFGIIIDSALFDSDQNVFTESSSFGISQLSVRDEQGRLLDLGSIQITMQGISKQTESSINVWGSVDFFLDDDKVDSKKIWGSQTNTNKLELSLIDSLVFDTTDALIVVRSIDSLYHRRIHCFIDFSTT